MKTETNFTQRTLRIRHVAKKTSLATSSIWRLVQQGHFPLPIKLSPGCTAWYEHEIDEWIDTKAAEREFLPKDAVGDWVQAQAETDSAPVHDIPNAEEGRAKGREILSAKNAA